MPQIHIPASLRSHTDGQSVITVDGEVVADALVSIFNQHPSLKPALMDEAQHIHPFFNLFVGENNIRDMQQLDTPISATQALLIVPALAGG